MLERLLRKFLVSLITLLFVIVQPFLRGLVKVKKETPEYIFWSGSTTPEDAPSYFQKLYRKVFKAAGVEGSSHDFRHTFAIEQAETRRRYTNGEQGAGAFVSNSD